MRRPLALPFLLLAFAVFLTGAPTARAELVVLDNGHYLKVAEYRLDGEKARLKLVSGGRLTLPLARIERVVDDEILPEPPVGEELAAAAGLAVGFADGQAVPATPYGAEIYAAARRHALNPDLVAAVVRAESAFDHRAVSVKGARGLMQLMPATARRFGLAEADLFDPERNLEAGVSYLAWLLARFGGDLTRALAAYNAGEGTVDRYDGVPPYRETHAYIRRIYKTLGAATELSL